MEFSHKSVLLEEAIDALKINPNGIYLDGTAGGGGHSLEIVKRLGGGHLYSVDKDEEALRATESRLTGYETLYTLIHSDYKEVEDSLDNLGVDRLDGILLDLGVSSYQLDEAERGFSYMKDAPLDMRMDRSTGITAAEVLATYSEKELADVFFRYGEEKLSRKIAARIVARRADNPIATTLELSDLVTECYPRGYQGGHPAKRVFQALRIEVNGELKGLGEYIEKIALRLRKGGRFAIITFHSLEDRIVKQSFKYLELDCVCPKNIPVCVCGKRKEGIVITNKPILPSEEEIKNNKRALSAKLRVFEKI